MPVRVLHVIGTMNQGGAETLIMELYRRIDKTKIQFDFFEYDYNGQRGYFDQEIFELGGKVYYAKGNIRRNPVVFFKELFAFFREHPEYTIVHSHQYVTTGFILTVAKRCHRFTVAHVHAIRKKKKISFHELMERYACSLIKKNADYVLGCSEDALNSMVGSYSDNCRILLFKNAIDTKKFAFSEERRLMYRREFSLEKSKVVGCVARFSKVKNHSFLLDAFASALQTRSDLKLLLVGEGPEKHLIAEKAELLGIADSIIFTGLRADVDGILNAMDAFCLPSLSEGLGIVFIEAQGNGLPCIVPKAVVPPEADIGASLFDRVSLEESVKVWGSHIVHAVEQNRARSEIVLKKLLESGYDIHSAVDWLERFYSDILLKGKQRENQESFN